MSNRVISEEDLENLRDPLSYVFVDGGHHKQYALVQIAKYLIPEDEWDAYWAEHDVYDFDSQVDPGIPE